MKRTRYLPWLLGAALLGLLPGPSAAQSVRPPAGADSLRRKLYQVFAPLDASQVPTGYLAEYATPLLPLYPNPARETVDVHLDHPDAAQPVTVRLFDGYGRLRAEQVSRGEATLRLKTDQLPAGLYFVHLLRGNQVLKREQLRIEK